MQSSWRLSEGKSHQKRTLHESSLSLACPSSFLGNISSKICRMVQTTFQLRIHSNRIATELDHSGNFVWRAVQQLHRHKAKWTSNETEKSRRGIAQEVFPIMPYQYSHHLRHRPKTVIHVPFSSSAISNTMVLQQCRKQIQETFIDEVLKSISRQSNEKNKPSDGETFSYSGTKEHRRIINQHQAPIREPCPVLR